LGESTKVLIVDDEPDIAAEMAALLAGAGVETAQAQDANAALGTFAADLRIGVVVCDIRMPRRSGLEFVRGLRTVGARGRLARVIFCTGYADTDSAIDALRLGAVEFLRKPVDPSELLAAVRKAADGYRQDAEGDTLKGVAVRDLAQVLESFRNFVRNGAATAEAAAAGGGELRLRKAGHLLAIRRRRDTHLPAAEFDEALLFMLLDLYQAEAADQRVSVSSLCLASGIPQTTALRRIDEMVARGLAERIPDPKDRRRAFVELSDDARARLGRFLDSVSLGAA
jgi:FixJ family two-component response regulator/DNA-binding MarR family transcriptional regulator